MNFYLTQVMSGHGAFNTYLFRMKLAESPKCANCDRRGQDDDAWHTPFECPAFQLHQEDVMTTLQEVGEQSHTAQFGTNYAEKRRWMGPGGRLCPFDNAPQNGIGVGVTEAADSRRHPAPNARPYYPPCL